MDVAVDGQVAGANAPKVLAAWLARAGAPACSSGWAGKPVWQEGGGSFGERFAGAAPPANSRRFALSFPRDDANDPLRGDSVVDVQLDAPGEPCLRVPFAGAAPSLAWPNGRRWFAGMAFRYSFVTPTIDGAHEVVSLAVRAGRWLGPVRVTAEAGAGLHGCRDGCAGGGFQWLEGALGVEGFIVRRDGWALGVDGSYTVLPAVGDPTSNQRLVHGPRLSVRLVRTEKTYPGLPSGPEVRSHGLEVFAAERFFAGDSRAGLVVGVGLIGDDAL